MHTVRSRVSYLRPTSSRREPAPHPGPALQREYLDPLGIDAATLAAQIDIDPERLQRMLAGVDSIDVETAIRLARSLQINPKLLMERQVRHDFAIRRADPELEALPVLANDGFVTFPDHGFLRGGLVGIREASGWGEVRPETLAFFADGRDDDLSNRIYEIKRGARLRVYKADGEVEWIGVVLQSLEGRPLLPFVRPKEWQAWFANHRRADFIPAEQT